jgi:hypothetical protein
MDVPETHPVHAHGTGHRWFDIAVGASALFVAVMSLLISIHHGQTMERLVKANSFPYVVVGLGFLPTEAPDTYSFELEMLNSGVGLAKIEMLEIQMAGQAVRSAKTIMDELTKILGKPVGRGSVTSVVSTVLPANEKRAFLRLELTGSKEAIATVVRYITALDYRVCYCSVLDECFAGNSRVANGRPSNVDSCPASAIPYDDQSNVWTERAASAVSAAGR